MNKGAGILAHQQILSLQLRRLCLLIAKCCLKSWKNSLIFHMAQSGTLFTNVQGTEKCAAGGSLDNWQRTTRKTVWVHPSLISSTLMTMVKISWSKSLPGMKLGTIISSPTRKKSCTKRFKSHDDVKHEVQTWLHGLDPTFYRQGFEKWISCLDKCLSSECDYVRLFGGNKIRNLTFWLPLVLVQHTHTLHVQQSPELHN